MGSSGKFWYKPFLEQQSKIVFAGLFILFIYIIHPYFDTNRFQTKSRALAYPTVAGEEGGGRCKTG